MSKEVQVASSIYNMAGDEKDRPQFLKNLIVRNVLTGTKQSLGDTITTGYLKGPGIKFRSFFRWVDEENYDLIGMPTGQVSVGNSVTPSLVDPHIPAGANQTIWTQEAWVDDRDYGLWVDQYMMEFHNDLRNTDYSADYNEANGTITITFEDTTTATFTPANFTKGAKYVYAYYNIVDGQNFGPLIIGSPVDLGPDDPWPSTTGFILDSDVSSSHTTPLVETTTILRTYSDGRPDETETDTDTSTGSWTANVRTYHRDTYVGQDPSVPDDQHVSTRGIRILFENSVVATRTTSSTNTTTISPGVTRTTTTTVVEEYLQPVRSYRNDSRKIIEQRWSPLKLFIYQIGTGISALDNLVEILADYGKFYPMFPVRLDNRFLSTSNWPAAYAQVKKAYKKATDGGKFDELVEKIADHDDVGDMDYVYAVFGVSLNVVEKSCRKYLYRFFQKMAGDQAGGKSAYDDYVNYEANYAAAYQLWLAWKNAGGNGTEPTLPTRPSLSMNQIRITNSGSLPTNYDMRIDWAYIREVTGQVGQGRAGAKTGDLWFVNMGRDDFAASVYGGWASGASVDKIRLYWQDTDNTYKYLDIVGLIHRNYIYEGHHVTITAAQALADGKESGFIVPLHYGTYREMPLKDATQMSTACLFLVINCYTVRYKQWWESWWFRILLVVVIAIVSVVFTGGAGIGLLGSHMAVGGFFGLTGISGAIAGAVVNALAAVVLTSIIEWAATQLFGEQWGPLISAIVSFVVITSIMNFQMGNGFGFNLADLMKAENLLKLTDALVTGYQGYVAGEIKGMQTELEKIQQQAEAHLQKVREKFFNEFGIGGGQIDPLWFVDNTPVMAESRDTFLTRTLMTGSDIANLSHDLLSDYVGLSLTLPNAFT